MSGNRSARAVSSWIGGLAGLFGKAGRKWLRSQATGRRSLRFECLEDRNLLSADVLSSLSGVAFHDLTGNGLTSDDVRLPNVEIRLSRDGGNGHFDSTGGDDTLLSTARTDATGNYRFNNLSPGTYFVQQLAAAGLVLSPGTDVSTVNITANDLRGAPGIVIDSFDTTSQAAASFSSGRTAVATVNAPEAVGGRRDLFVQLTSAFGALGLDANVSIPGMLDFSAGSAANGIRRVVWDGPGGDPQVVNPGGLNHVDLTSAGASTGIRLALGADHDHTAAVLKILSDANNWSSASIPVPNTDDGSLGQEVFVPFASFVGGGGRGADFTDVGAIQLDINGPNAVDGQVDGLSAIGPTVFTRNFANLAQTDLSIVKSEAPIPAVSGEQLTYTLAAFNNGPSSASGVTITDTLPPGVAFESASVSQGTTNIANGVLTVHLGNLLSGSGATTTIVVAVDPGATATLTNTATITGNEPDPNLANNTSTVTTQLNAQTDLAIIKTGLPEPVTAGDRLTYTLQSANNGPSNATGVTVTDTLPAGVSYVSATSSQGTVSFAGGVVTVGLGNLAAGATASTTIVVGVSAAATGSITNTAIISGNQPDTNPANNRSSVTTYIDVPFIPEGDPDVDVAITKLAQPDPVTAGATLTYALLVTNLSPTAATGVRIVDALPAGVSLVSASSSQGSTAVSNGVVTVNLGTMGGGSTATVTMVVVVNQGASGSLVNTATVSENEIDSDPSNNQSSVVTGITPQVTPPLSKRRFLGR